MVFGLLSLSLQACHLLYRIISVLLECLDDAHLVIGTKCFKRDRQFYCRIAICADKLIVFKFNDIALLLSDDRRHTSSPGRSGSSTDMVKILSL